MRFFGHNQQFLPIATGKIKTHVHDILHGAHIQHGVTVFFQAAQIFAWPIRPIISAEICDETVGDCVIKKFSPFFGEKEIKKEHRDMGCQILKI